MKYFAVIALLGFVQAGVLAGPTEPAPSTTGTLLEEAFARATLALGNMTQEVSKVLGVKDLSDGQKVLTALASGTESLAQKVGAIVIDLQKEVTTHTGDINGILKSVQTRLNSTLQELQTPEMQAKAVQVQKQLESGLNSLISESRRLASAAVTDISTSQSEIAKITNKALEDVIDTASKVQERIKTAIASAAPSSV